MRKLSLTIAGIMLLMLAGIYACMDAGSVSGTSKEGNPESETVSAAVDTIDKFEIAVSIIKKYEGLHQPRHWPLVGYGHKILSGERFSRKKALSEEEAEALLRKDLLKNCAVFRSYGADSLILGVLAYNIGMGNVKRSSVAASLRAGNRDIRERYVSYSRYKGKVMSHIRRRRIEEFDNLFLMPDSIKQALNILKKKTPDGNKTALAFVTTSIIF